MVVCRCDCYSNAALSRNVLTRNLNAVRGTAQSSRYQMQRYETRTSKVCFELLFLCLFRSHHIDIVTVLEYMKHSVHM